MAKKKTATRTSSGTKSIVVRSAAPKPVVLRETRVVHSKPKKSGARRHHAGGGSQKAATMDAMLSAGGFALLEKSSMGAMIPSLPMGGKAGTVGLLLYFIGGKYRKWAAGPLAVATYQAMAGMQLAPGVSGWGPGVAAVMP